MFTTCFEKQQKIKDLFLACSGEDARYQKIIELGKKLPLLDPQSKNPANLVKGCQSTMYLQSTWQGDLICFAAESDAIISSGLAAVLIFVYSEETPETILKCNPEFLEALGICASLSPGRANGLYSIHLKMKQDALHMLIEREKK